MSTVGMERFVARLRPKLQQANDGELWRRLDRRCHVQLMTASWLMEQMAELNGNNGGFWASQSDVSLMQVAERFRSLTNKPGLEPLFMIDQVVAASYPSTSSGLNIMLRVSSREICEALICFRRDYQWLKDNYDIELTIARWKK